MRQFHTVVLERLERFRGSLETEPFEVGWANEAVLFIEVSGLSGSGSSVKASVQISVDGINWIDEGTEVGPLVSDGRHFVRLSHFGGWLRATFQIEGDTEITLTSQLALKG